MAKELEGCQQGDGGALGRQRPAPEDRLSVMAEVWESQGGQVSGGEARAWGAGVGEALPLAAVWP